MIYKRRGAGTYISDSQSPLADRERRRIIASRIDALLAEAHQLDFDADELLELLRDRQRFLGENDKTGTEEPEKNDE